MDITLWKKECQKLETMEMKMLRIGGVTLLDKIRNEDIKKKCKALNKA